MYKIMMAWALLLSSMVSSQLIGNEIRVQNKGTGPIEAQINERGNLIGNKKFNEEIFPGRERTWIFNSSADITIWSGANFARRPNLSNGYKHLVVIYDDKFTLFNYYPDNALQSQEDVRFVPQ